MAGMCTPPFLLHRMIALDVLHVWDLGVTRLLVQRLVRVFPSMCVGHDARFGSLTATYGEVFVRLSYLGRRSRASRVAPGYAPGDDERQAAFTGREQRRGVWILPFSFAGLFDCGAPVGGRRAQAAVTAAP